MDDHEHKGSEEDSVYLRIIKTLRTLRNPMDGIGDKEAANRAIKGLILILIIGFTFTLYKVIEIRTRAVTVYLGDEMIGITRNEDEVLDILADIEEQLASTYDLDIVLNQDVEFKGINARRDSITPIEVLKSNIKSKFTFLVNGYALQVDGKEIGVLATEEEIEDLLNRIKEPYLKGEDGDTDIVELNLLEEIEVTKKQVPLDRVVDVDKLFEYVTTGGKDIREHIVEVGESLWTIATIYKIPADDLIEANPNLDPDRIQIGERVKLIVSKPMITVETIERNRYTERIDYEVKVEQNSNMYTNEKKVKVEGSPGEKEVVARLIKHNGVVVDKEILEDNVIKEPTDQLVVRGTKEVPRTVATGSFLMPTRGSITSRYGIRNGRMHKGLDIAARTGTPIRAADGGRVTFAGNSGAYGNLVQIDHGNGYSTKYAHCSTIGVAAGQRVYRGQVIAKVGSTGRSTGAHLHFEILKNGRNINPAANIR
ncbi:MAG: peptidoglycan DD-metalloendopeptidase family protein [Tissierellia bacterium]|nr:peptidoglycan DD-metalloendopeptidase family protein [Tissierellia bacterium]